MSPIKMQQMKGEEQRVFLEVVPDGKYPAYRLSIALLEV